MNSTTTPILETIECIDIADDTVGNVSLSVPDVTKPLWHGDYQGGKLSVYLAAIKGKPKCVFTPLIYVISGLPQLEANYVGFSCIAGDTGLDKKVNNLLAHIHSTYLKCAMSQKEAHGTTIH